MPISLEVFKAAFQLDAEIDSGSPTRAIVGMLQTHLKFIEELAHTDDLEDLEAVANAARAAAAKVDDSEDPAVTSYVSQIRKKLGPLDRLIARLRQEAGPAEAQDPTAEEDAAEPAGNEESVAPGNEQEVRALMASQDVSDMDDEAIIALGADTVVLMREKIEASGKFITCNNTQEMAVAMAEDEDTSVEDARRRLESNQARGFTAEKTGVIYFLECDEKPHDIIHETVHVCSADGGTTLIHTEFSEALNEGFTETFAIEFCKALGVPVAPAYPDEVAFVAKLRNAVDTPMIHAAYMQNQGMGAIINVLSRRWEQRADDLQKKFSTRKFVPPKSDGERKTYLTEQLKNNSFLDGTGKQFWRAILD